MPFRFQILDEEDPSVSIGLINDGYFQWYLKSIEIPKEVDYRGLKYTVVEIMDSGFQNIHSVESLTIPNSIKRIQSFAFSESLIKEFTISESLEYIGRGAFNGCPVHSFIISEDNPYFVGEGSIIYNKDKTIIIWYKSDEKELFIPEGITQIGSYSFWCYPTFSITLPSSIEKIGSYAFIGSPYILSFTCLSVIPPSLEDFIFKYGYDHEIYYDPPLIYVPKESVELYKNAPIWKEFYRDFIFPIKETGLDNISNENEQSYEIYSIDGRYIMRTTDANYASRLEPGLYIVNGKKTLIRK